MINRQELIQKLTKGLSIGDFSRLIHDEHLLLRMYNHRITEDDSFAKIEWNYNYRIQQDKMDTPICAFQLEYVYDFVQSIETNIEEKKLTTNMPVDEILGLTRWFLSKRGVQMSENLTVNEVNTLYIMAYFLNMAIK